MRFDISLKGSKSKMSRAFKDVHYSAHLLNEIRLLKESGDAYPKVGYDSLSATFLAKIAQERGVDFATALFYNRIRNSNEHGPFINEIDSLIPIPTKLPQFSGRVLIVPAAFYREYPKYGGDGRLIREVAAGFGLEARLLSLPSTGTVTENAALIRQALAAEPDKSVILVSLSKGGADVRIALEAGGLPLRKVQVWLQICGLIRGSPLIDQLLNGRWWQRVLLSGYLTYMGANIRLAKELTHQSGSLLANPAFAPPEVLVINVLGFPLTFHLVRNVRRRHQKLAPFGPNDGSTLLRDAIVEAGLTYPVWGADHYFQVPEASQLLHKLFLYLGRSGVLVSSNRKFVVANAVTATRLPVDSASS